MKAEIHSCVISDSVIDQMHGAYYSINRLVIPNENNLTITPHQGNVYIWANKDWAKGEVVAEIEISDELVAAAKGLLEAKKGLMVELLGGGPELAQHFTSQYGDHQ